MRTITAIVAVLLLNPVRAMSAQLASNAPSVFKRQTVMTQGIVLTSEQRDQIVRLNERYEPQFQALVHDHPGGATRAYQEVHQARVRALSASREAELLLILTPQQRVMFAKNKQTFAAWRAARTKGNK